MPSGYFALGDSMSIDAYAGGPGLGAASLLADDLGIDLTMLAADGATSDDVVHRQLGQVHGRPALITLTMGGNDLLTTLVSAPAPAALSAAVTRIAENYETALMSLTATGARVIATTVYDPSDGTGDLSLVGLPEMAGGAAVLDTLNTMIRESATRHGAALADVHAAFLGHGTSAGDISSPDSHPANRDLWFCGHIEPNAWGARAIRDTWRRVLQSS
ncbi:SGNH/GDSL hydrolase family protein [Dactylosporangium sp. AC04546]|uniref:SGNH/GDSL hydrolase family protein n=1 Tax=Dactylosporangium sp. AC04546 TaxID=2862460 RepID=UPI001EDFAF54|nr:SGNH/GDSL hydrolase family protein [Dactylosporangium sp. AC04546]WVK82068.1 SGNH/GDSL hydrolase family protein [Dactylosporangium sp. AC04546]